MRPVNKPHPAPYLDIVPTRLPTIRETVRTALFDTIGRYCSFCEMPLKISDAIVSKKDGAIRRRPSLDDWSDLLVACDFCMEARTEKNITLQNFIWPDTDTSFALGAASPFLYVRRDVTIERVDEHGGILSEPSSAVIIEVNPAANQLLQDRAQATIDLHQLNTINYVPTTRTFIITPDTELLYDPRVRDRTEAWDMAVTSAADIRRAIDDDLPAGYTRNLEKMITNLAQETGFWSIWMTVFREYFNEDQVDELLIRASTRSGYSISGYQSILPESRPGGGVQGDQQGGYGPFLFFTGTARERIGFAQ